MTTGTHVAPDRLRRASERRVKRIGPAVYQVEGRSELHYRVDLEAPAPCSCVDARARGRGCLHELAARLAAGDPELVNQLGTMLADAERELRRTRVRLRRAVERRTA